MLISWKISWSSLRVKVVGSLSVQMIGSGNGEVVVCEVEEVRHTLKED